jgi:hypothetical protein
LIGLVFSINRLLGETPAPAVEFVHNSRIFVHIRLVLFHIDPVESLSSKRMLPLGTPDFDCLVRQLKIDAPLPDAEDGGFFLKIREHDPGLRTQANPISIGQFDFDHAFSRDKLVSRLHDHVELGFFKVLEGNDPFDMADKSRGFFRRSLGRILRKEQEGQEQEPHDQSTG